MESHPSSSPVILDVFVQLSELFELHGGEGSGDENEQEEWVDSPLDQDQQVGVTVTEKEGRQRVADDVGESQA